MAEYLKLRVERIINEARDAISVVLREINGNEINYRAGQFFTILVEINGRTLRRSYSLSSTPGIDVDLVITIKRVTNGEVSRFLIDYLKVGDIIQAIDPAGRFVLETKPSNKRDIFLIGAGSGITPIFSIVKDVLNSEPLSRVTLIDCNNNQKDILFGQQLKELSEKYPDNLNLIHFLSNPGPDFRQFLGRLNIEHLEKLVLANLRFNRAEAIFMVCGPFTFMRMVRMTLIYMGFEEDQIRKENFVIKTPVSEIVLPRTFAAQDIKLIINKRETSLKIQADTTILDAALSSGISLPYSCKAGVCSTCLGICRNGKVYMVNNEVLTEKEVNAGYVLTCVAYPISHDVIIEIS